MSSEDGEMDPVDHRGRLSLQQRYEIALRQLKRDAKMEGAEIETPLSRAVQYSGLLLV